MPCYEHKPGLNLEGAWPPAEQLCTYRFMTLAEAQAVCSSESRCDGVTVDGGVECGVERSEYASAFPDGLKWRFPYSCRSRPTKMWPANSGIGSWLKQRGGSTGSTCDEAKLGEERPTCPVRSKMAVAAHTPPPQQRAPPKKEPPPSPAVVVASSAEDVEPHPPRAITRAAELERLSAAEATAIDAADVARGTCPSDIRESSAATPSTSSSSGLAVARLPTRCGGVVSWFEQLSELEQSTGGGAEDCTAARAARCILTHNGRPDGWGGQHFRRVRTLLSAVQLGCSYVHVPLFPMNANSQQHGIAHTAGEKFFGLSDYCYQPVRARAVRTVDSLETCWLTGPSNACFCLLVGHASRLSHLVPRRIWQRSGRHAAAARHPRPCGRVQHNGDRLVDRVARQGAWSHNHMRGGYPRSSSLAMRSASRRRRATKPLLCRPPRRAAAAVV